MHKLEWTWVVRIGPFQHYMEAWETMMKIPTPEMTVVPFGDDPGKRSSPQPWVSTPLFARQG